MKCCRHCCRGASSGGQRPPRPPNTAWPKSVWPESHDPESCPTSGSWCMRLPNENQCSPSRLADEEVGRVARGHCSDFGRGRRPIWTHPDASPPRWHVHHGPPSRGMVRRLSRVQQKQAKEPSANASVVHRSNTSDLAPNLTRFQSFLNPRRQILDATCEVLTANFRGCTR